MGFFDHDHSHLQEKFELATIARLHDYHDNCLIAFSVANKLIIVDNILDVLIPTSVPYVIRDSVCRDTLSK